MRHPKGFPAKLARLRANAEMTQKDLAKVSGISVPQIGRYETGLSMPRMTALVKLSKALGVTVEQLQDFDDEPESVSIILEEQDGVELPMTIQKTAMDKLQQLSDDTGQPLEEVISGALLWGLKMIKENPEMADDFRKRIAASKKKDSSGG
ncbi:Helix-turn-helix [Pseudomonas putida]|uniref:helix-turn-helix domain-containing protein n=1 Tax=Pseudomonas juntendi TaxID=2666183 RepID=UPI001E7FC027|nr:helix-turn-helix transcriptional regulator [Pseudomonas juntendi]MDG9811124.1 helix-turn-helix transcriptional regulator [Pseudomonas juntendi]CAB5623337.1 Helix-turn-helix [Pseudomonas putida]CAC9676209.1 Helix-turn-helix [Pseudomonas putida]